jgi:putative aldouronate transport system permease protein
MFMFYAVFYWNLFMPALLYISDKKLQPLQLVLRGILLEAKALAMAKDEASVAAEQAQLVGLIKYGVVIVASVPVLIMYPLLQKYFVQGVMIGAVKG